MGFGTGTAGVTSRQTNYNVNVAEMLDETGGIYDMTTYGGAEETVLEQYVDAGTFSNEATNAQSGSSVVSSHSLIESNTEYARETKTTRVSLTATTT